MREKNQNLPAVGKIEVAQNRDQTKVFVTKNLKSMLFSIPCPQQD